MEDSKLPLRFIVISVPELFLKVKNLPLRNKTDSKVVINRYKD
jgi:hypothetical protein